MSQLAERFVVEMAAGIVLAVSGEHNDAKRVIDEPPTVRITGQCRSDRGTIGRSSADRDYRMSTYDKAAVTAAIA